MKYFLGFDPGKDGAAACIDEHLSIPSIKVSLTPTAPTGKGAKRDYLVQAMVMLVKEFCSNDFENTFAIIEKQQSMPGQGVASTFSIGRGFGLWEGIVGALGISYQIVHPRTWKKVMLRDIPGKGADKGRSIVAAGQLFPSVDLRKSERARKAHDGIAEALLIAEYGRRVYNSTL